MSGKSYNKLVRDRIPDIIESSGKSCDACVLDNETYTASLKEKLLEEVAEYLTDNTLEELADILEVLHALADSMGHTFEDVEKLRIKKKLSRGGFEKRIFLRRVSE